MEIGALAGPSAAARTAPRDDTALREASLALEASFLSEMLKGAGLGEPRGSFGGGAGEEQFASMLRGFYADEIARRGGIGLAEVLFRALSERADAR